MLRPASWPDALAEAAQSLASLKQAGRPLGVLGSGRASNEENFLAVALARAALGTGNVDSGLGACYDALLPGARETSGPRFPIEALESADVIVALEGDLAASHPRLAHAVMRALRRGGRLVTLGWWRTQLSELASLHVPLSVASPLDTLRALQAQVRMRLTSADAAAGAADGHALAAAWIAGSERAAFILPPFDSDVSTLRAAAALLGTVADALSGAGRGEPMVLALPVRANTRGALDMGVTPDRLAGRRALDDRDMRERLWFVWRGQPCWEPGLDAEAMPFGLAGLVVVADDVAAFHAAPSSALEALAGLNGLVVLDSFLTPTARAAHVVLPIAAFGESDGTATNLEGRVQPWRAWGSPPDGVRPGWRVLCDLLGALDASFRPESLDAVRRAIMEVLPSYAAPETANAAGHAGPGGGPDLIPDLPESDAADPAEGRMLLRREAVFDWGADPLASSSPILRREPLGAAKLHPAGVVVMNPEAAAALGVREGWRVRLESATGAVEAPVTLRAGLERGLLLVPFAFRDLLAGMSRGAAAVEVEVTRA